MSAISHCERLRAYSTGQGLALSNPIRLEGNPPGSHSFTAGSIV